VEPKPSWAGSGDEQLLVELEVGKLAGSSLATVLQRPCQGSDRVAPRGPAGCAEAPWPPGVCGSRGRRRDTWAETPRPGLLGDDDGWPGVGRES
jgi:hypothetical protein